MIPEIIASTLEGRSSVFLNNFEKEVKNIEIPIVIFLYAGWSQSNIQLRVLNDSLKDFPQIELYIFDIDHNIFCEYADKNKIHSDGWGETLWVKNGEIISELKKYNLAQIGKLVANHLSII